MVRKEVRIVFLFVFSILLIVSISNFVSAAACAPGVYPCTCKCGPFDGDSCDFDAECGTGYLCTNAQWFPCSPTGFCGDHTCNNGETCATCPGDCNCPSCTTECNNYCGGTWNGVCSTSAIGVLYTSTSCSYTQPFYFPINSHGCYTGNQYCNCQRYCGSDTDCPNIVSCSDSYTLRTEYWYCHTGHSCERGLESPNIQTFSCGSTTCSYPHTSGNCLRTCGSGTCNACTPSCSCTSGYLYCDGSRTDADGCEQPTSVTNGVLTSCSAVTCTSPYLNCDGNALNGCETAYSLSNCGSCGAVCNLPNAAESCSSSGICQLGTCSSGYGNCDGIAYNGCETALTSSSNCGSCGTTCTLPYVCQSGSCGCVPSCSGKECGPNGCGGVCGYCPSGWNCPSGTCIGCGDGSCNNGETCSSCSTDCGSCCGNGAINSGEACDDGDTSSGDGCSSSCTVESGYTCSGAPSTCTLCLINSAYWNPSSGVEDGDTVTLGITTNSACNGKSFTFLVRRNALIDSTISTINSVAPSSGSATRSWYVDIANEGNYYLRATLDERSSVTRDSGDVAITLPYVPSCPSGVCDAGENCATCATDCRCTSPQTCQSGTCTLLCDLTNAYWSPSSGVESGDSVSLVVQGSNCNGKTITFEVREEDFLSYDYIASPSSRTMSSGSATTSWTATAPDPDGETSPTYYFIATVSDDSDSYKSGNMIVTIPVPPVTCGNGAREGTEQCDDGDTISGDGCSASCTIESGWNCNSATPNVCTPICGDGLIRGTEACDDGDTISGDGCSATCTVETGYTCTNEPSICNPRTECGSNGCQPGLGEDCSNCATDCACTGSGEVCQSGTCVPSVTCGIGGCQPSFGEDCQTCPGDCGSCCGNSVINSGEACDDGNTGSGDGCSATCTVESGWTCVSEPSVCTYCGNGAIEGSEGCDDGDTTPGDGCSSTCTVETDWGCVGEPSVCNPLPSCGRNGCEPAKGETCNNCATDCGDCCGDNTCTSGYGEDCETCPEDCTWNPATEECVDGEIVLSCDLTSAYWSTTSTLSDGLVLLNVEGTNCNGKNISFVVMERDDDGLFDADDPVTHDPANIIYGSPTTYGTWVAELQDDSAGFEENPPEYYFVATVVTTGESVTSSQNDEDMLKVYDEEVICAGINYCSNYATESDCESDLCTTGVNSVPETVTCGGSFNSATGCYDYTNCGCAWDAVSQECGADWNFESSCGVCGNHVRDFGEECDDGNVISGDGCSDTCEFEGTLNPCGEGLTLCLDGTCSLNCYITDVSVSDCNYDAYCDADEGCTCSDCDGEQDACILGLLCSIFDTGCCTSTSDNECNPYCAFVDPDCGPADCGNGIMELGEECDLGTRNDVTNSGCLADCTLEVIIPGENGCPEGTTLCSDGTCSLNCYQTDEGVAPCNNDGYCDTGEGCTCSDCDGEEDTCESGLLCSLVDQACCNNDEDDFCNEYCAFVDPDCESSGGSGKGIFSVGTCVYTETSQDTCEDDGMLTRALSALWTWDPENILHIDPLRKQDSCVYIEDTFSCPASVEVSFFGFYQFIIAIGIVGLIYLIYILRKKNHSKHKRKNKKK